MLVAVICILLSVFSLGVSAQAQSEAGNYKVINVSDGGTITGTVKWSGPIPKALSFPVTKDPTICDPESTKHMDLDRLVVAADGGVANTVVFLKNIHQGKEMETSQVKPLLDQKR